MELSIIIPVYNEADIIDSLLKHLLDALSYNHKAEIILVDGGSTDNTVLIVNQFLQSHNGLKTNKPQSNFPIITILNSAKGRAKQMNYGAKNAKGGVLYFLHADSFPPKNFDTYILDAVKKGSLAGCFRMQFNSKHWWLRLASWFTIFSWRACRGGDQSQFITKKLFNEIGGYNEDFIIYEDYILINQLYKRKQFIVINKKIVTSARLYKKVGVWKLQYLFWTIYLKRWLGATPAKLYAYYKSHIS